MVDVLRRRRTRVVEKDANGELSIAFNTERNIELATKGLEDSD